MLIKLNGVTFNPDLIAVSFWSPDRETLNVYLSPTEGGRKITLPEEDGQKLELFLATHNLVDLDGPAFQKAAFQRTAELKADLHAREAIKGTLLASEALKLADGQLNAIAGQSRRQGVETGPREVVEVQPMTLTPKPSGLSVVPPAPPLGGDDFEPDPSLFVAKTIRRVPSIIDNL